MISVGTKLLEYEKQTFRDSSETPYDVFRRGSSAWPSVVMQQLRRTSSFISVLTIGSSMMNINSINESIMNLKTHFLVMEFITCLNRWLEVIRGSDKYFDRTTCDIFSIYSSELWTLSTADYSFHWIIHLYTYY